MVKKCPNGPKVTVLLRKVLFGIFALGAIARSSALCLYYEYVFHDVIMHVYFTNEQKTNSFLSLVLSNFIQLNIFVSILIDFTNLSRVAKLSKNM